MKLFKRILTIIKHPGSLLYPHTWSNQAYIDFIRKHGGKIGNNTRFISPSQCYFDMGRADYISIGDNCCLSYVSLIAHDYSWYTMLESCEDILPDSGGRITIGNNCFIGYRATILKDTKIGNNVIIGAGSVVKGNIPDNTVWAGIPAKQICTVEELYQKRLKNRIDSAISRRNHIREASHREPTIREMGFFSMLYMERTEQNYSTYIRDLEFNGVKGSNLVKDFFFKTKPIIASFDDFLNL